MQRTLVLVFTILTIAGCGGPLFLNDATADGGSNHDGAIPSSTDAAIPSPTDIAISALCQSVAAPVKMPTYSTGGAAAASDGLLYLVAATDNTQAFAYDPTSATWTSAGNLPSTPQGQVQAVAIGHTVYAVADTLLAYDIPTKTWSTKTPRSPAYVNTAAAAGPDGKIYVVGGTSSAVLSSPAVYDPATDSWSTLPAAPASDSEQTAVFVGTKLYVIGAQLMVFDLSTSKWSTLPPPSVPRSGGVSGVVGGKLILAGGAGTGQNGLVQTADTETFDLATSTWTTVAPMPDAVREAGAAVGCDGRFYVFGGDDGTPTGEVQVYDPTNNTWQLSL